MNLEIESGNTALRRWYRYHPNSVTTDVRYGEGGNERSELTLLIRYSVILKLVVAEGTMTCIDHAIAKSINEVVINN